MNAKNFKTLVLAFSGAVLTLGACTPTPTPSPKTKMELITASPWKYSQAGIDQNNDGTIDLPLPASLLPTCATDNVLTFSANGNGVADEGATKCSETTPQMVPFTFSFSNNDTQLIFSTTIFAGIGGDVKLVELTETRMTLSKTVPVTGFPIALPVTVVLVH